MQNAWVKLAGCEKELNTVGNKMTGTMGTWGMDAARRG